MADELYAIQVVDGVGRVIGAAGNHPGSDGGYKAQLTIYDQMGRAMKKASNPAEVTSTWVPTGDDSAGMALHAADLRLAGTSASNHQSRQYDE